MAAYMIRGSRARSGSLASAKARKRSVMPPGSIWSSDMPATIANIVDPRPPHTPSAQIGTGTGLLNDGGRDHPTRPSRRDLARRDHNRRFLVGRLLVRWRRF